MGGRGSGGWNALPVSLHMAKNTYRADRHGHRRDPAPVPQLSAADRKRTLAGLGPEARRLAAAVLDQFGDWDQTGLVTLRLWAMSAERLAVITDDTERRRETRTLLALRAALRLDS